MTNAVERVAIQGELGSFSHEAALALAPGAAIVPCALSADVFRSLIEGSVELAVIPIENSLAGSVLEHYDLLLANDVRIEREHLLRIRHTLIAPPGASLTSLREVYSHPIALEQCRGFFRQHPYLRPAPFYDTAGSVKHVLSAPGGGAAGAIASRQAAVQYGGVLLAEGIEDNAENYTRFFLIRTPAQSREPVIGSALDREARADRSANKVSLCFAVENRPGSLVDALAVFAHHQINLTRLESRPVPGAPWQYIFYADYQMEQPGKADTALAELVRHCSMVKELGRYPAAVKS
jgi:prephenate dehydratase